VSRLIRYTSGFANFLAILTIMVEVISGAVIFMLYTIVQEIQFILPTYWDLLVDVLAVLLIAAFLLTIALLYTPLYEFLPYVTKVFISSLLAIFALLGPIIIGMNYSKLGDTVFLQYAFLSIVIFIAEAMIFYIIYAIRGRKLLFVTRHRKALEEISDGLRRITRVVKEKKDLDLIVDASNRAFKSWELIVKHELIERWDLSRIIFQALFIAMAFYVAALAIIFNVANYDTLIVSATVALFIFIIVLALVDTVQSERMRAIIK